jgi:hypothetical protein
MKHAHITVTRERGHFRIEVYVDAAIEPATVFGCREALLPILAAMETAEAQESAVAPRSESNTITTPATVTVRLPSGRYISYALVLAQDPTANRP